MQHPNKSTLRRKALYSALMLALPLTLAHAQEEAVVEAAPVLESSSQPEVAPATVAAPAIAEVEQEAGDFEMPTVVVSAAGYEQKIADAPASISVVSEADLRSKPYVTLLDAVRDLEGVDVGETTDKSGQGGISIRGMGSDYTLLLIDGKRQNNHGDLYPNNTIGGSQFAHLPSLDSVERIEVIRGPASTLYGADAMGGVINIITKKVTDKWTGSFTQGRTIQTNDDFGDDFTNDFNVSGPLIKGKLGLTLRGSLYNREASNPTYPPVTDPNGKVHTFALTGFGSGGRATSVDQESFGARLSWKIAENQSLSFDLDTSKQVYDNSANQIGTTDDITAIWKATPNNCIPAGTCTRANPSAGYAADQEVIRDNWSLTHEGKWDFGNSFVSLAHVSTDNNGRVLPFSVAERALLLEMINATGAYAGMTEVQRKAAAEAAFLPRPPRKMQSEQYTLDAKLDTSFQLAGQHVLVTGVQVIRGELDDSVFGLESGMPGATQEHNMYSLFVEDSWTVIDPLVVTTGVRYDDHEVFGSHVSPRLYGVYTIDSSWSVKGGVSTGFKTPKTTDLFDGVTGFGGQGTSPWVGNPDLKPETSVSQEVALYWQHPAERHNANLTFFKNRFEDKIENQTVSACTVTGGVKPCANLGQYAGIGYTTASQKINVREAEVQGAELAGRYQILRTLALRGNYTYTDSEQTNGTAKGRPLTNAAKHMANATLDWQATEKFNVFLNLERRDKRYSGWDTANNKPLYYKGYDVLHLGASYKASQSVTLNARVNNLLDEDFTSYTPSFTPVDANNDGVIEDYTVSKVDDYNNKDKSRNFWFGVNVRF